MLLFFLFCLVSGHLQKVTQINTSLFKYSRLEPLYFADHISELKEKPEQSLPTFGISDV